MSLNVKKLLLCTVIVACVALQKPRAFAEAIGIVAVVNDEIISMYDLNTRLAAVLALSKIPDSVQNRSKIIPQVIRTLIDERIKIQEARRLKITPSKTDLDGEKQNLEKRVGLKPGELGRFFSSRGVSPDAMDDQLESRAIWRLIISKLFGSRLRISGAEIENTLKEIKKNKGKVENLISEIYLKYNDRFDRRETLEFANKLLRKILSGADFAALAQNFSHDPSSILGGDLGWNLHTKFDTRFRAHIEKLAVGEVAGPISTDQGIHIFLLRDRRLSRGVDGLLNKKVKLNIFQLHFELSETESRVSREKILSQATGLSKSVKGCERFKAEIQKSNSSLSGELGTFDLRSINPKLRGMVETLPIGQASRPYQTKGNIIILMVCNRSGQKIQSNDTTKIRKIVRRRLRVRQLNLDAKRYFRDLRRNSFVEVRQ